MIVVIILPNLIEPSGYIIKRYPDILEQLIIYIQMNQCSLTDSFIYLCAAMVIMDIFYNKQEESLLARFKNILKEH